MASDQSTEEPAVIVFPDGIPGFPTHRRFVLVNFADDSVFQMMQSVDDPDISMVVASPWDFFPDYAPELSEIEQRDLGIEQATDAVVFCPVTITGTDLSMNLVGPFVVNQNTREGRQVVLVDDTYAIRTPIPVGAD